MRRTVVALGWVFILGSALALAQSFTNHAIPIGAGPGKVGWKIGGPCDAGQALVWVTGKLADPTCLSVGGAITPAALTRTNDTNVTLTLTGTPTTALLQSTGITVGWTGTLAAARLNSNVVQSIVNDTNVTGSIAAQALTLGWTGTLAAARLNANVVQAVTNDTNITGSIAAQNLTFAWSGTLAAARLNGNVVQSIVNDTNVTGSISAQALTLGWTGTLSVARGGTGAGTFTANGIMLGNGTSPLAVTAAMTNGQLLVGQTASAPLPRTISGDVTVASTGAVTIANNAVSNAKLAQANAYTIKGNLTNGTANVADNNVGTWSTFEPSVTCSAGSGTFTAPAIRYLTIGKLVFIRIFVTITAIGTCSGVMFVQLPVTAAAQFYSVSGQNVDTAVLVIGVINGPSTPGQANLFLSGGGFPGTTGNRILITGVYEAV